MKPSQGQIAYKISRSFDLLYIDSLGPDTCTADGSTDIDNATRSYYIIAMYSNNMNLKYILNNIHI